MNGKKVKQMRREAKRIAEEYKDKAEKRKISRSVFIKLLYQDLKKGG